MFQDLANIIERQKAFEKQFFTGVLAGLTTLTDGTRAGVVYLPDNTSIVAKVALSLGTINNQNVVFGIVYKGEAYITTVLF